MRYYLIAGEASGDLHASNIMKELILQDPRAELRFWGGDKMTAVGGTLVRHYKNTAVMGFVEVALKLFKILDNIRFCKKDLLQWKPDVLILVDYPGFNMRMAKWAKKQGFKVFYYIAPKVWAWKEGRIKALKAYTDKLYIIFPFEVPYFEMHGIETRYYGNPLIDCAKPYLDNPPDEAAFKRRHLLLDKDIIAVLPGSRKMEISYLLPRILELTARFPEHQFVVGGAPSIEPEFYHKLIGTAPITVVYNQTYPLLRLAKAAVVSSGTAALEAALLLCPQVVGYGGNPLSYHIAKWVVKLPYVTLVNLILDKPCIKELLQGDCTPQGLGDELERLLQPGPRRTMLADYKRLYKLLGKEGASQRLAQAMTEELRAMYNIGYRAFTDTPLGPFVFLGNREHITAARFAKERPAHDFYRVNPQTGEVQPVADTEVPDFYRHALAQLHAYFNGEIRNFNLPVQYEGTPFQVQVWEALRAIPFGTTRTYMQIAARLGNPKAARAVGQASNANPLVLIVPCHRVIGMDGKLVGYSGGVRIKQKLLLMEQSRAPELNNMLF